MRRTFGGSVAFVLLASTIAAQPSTVNLTVTRDGGPRQLEAALDRLSAYLVAYEPALSALVAEESFVQETIGRMRTTPAERRVLVSDVAFMRLPGEGPWLGYRDVRRVNAAWVR